MSGLAARMRVRASASAASTSPAGTASSKSTSAVSEMSWGPLWIVEIRAWPTVPGVAAISRDTSASTSGAAVCPMMSVIVLCAA